MKFPSEIQPDAMDCGPVSLKMIAKYYGKEFSLFLKYNEYEKVANASQSSTLASRYKPTQNQNLLKSLRLPGCTVRM
jgi:ABC-type bacteriocin/lantibiotic exporter with double-glycine peptidase domain